MSSLPIDLFNKLKFIFIMMTIKMLTLQEYENSSKSPSQICFYKNEKNICEIIANHLSETIEQNIRTLQKFQQFKNAEVYEIESKKGLLYLIPAKN